MTDEGPGLPEDMAVLLDSSGQAAPARGGKGLGLWTTGTLIQRLQRNHRIERPAVGTRVVVTLPAGVEGARHAA